MTPPLQQRLIFTVAITALTVVLGGVGGYFLGCAVVLRGTQHSLDDSAERIQERVAAYSSEANSVLARINAAQLPFCSHNEISGFHQLIFHSEFIRDIGRIRDGKIYCSAHLGQLAQSLPAPSPEFLLRVGANDYTIYRTFPPYEANVSNYAKQQGEYYVVLNSHRFSRLGLGAVQFVHNVSAMDRERIRQLWGVTLDIDPRLLGQSGTLWRNGTLYVTRCTSNSSSNRGSCTTTLISVHSALVAGLAQIRLCMTVGTLLGLALGLFCAYVFRFRPGMDRRLRAAIRKGQIQVVYQPIVELASGRIVEVEALARWKDEDGSPVSPAVFVPIAEQHGFIRELTALVVRRAVRDLLAMLRCDPAFRATVNITATDLVGDQFQPMLLRSLADSGIAPRNLAFEITESSTARMQNLCAVVRQLREMGHSVLLDDFGTGYSSLSYLQEISIDAIKIDRSFTNAIGTEAVTACILPQILQIAQSLNLQVIVEGIETVEQAAYFAGSSMNILGQGGFFGHPMSLQCLLGLLAESSRTSEVEE